MAKTYEEKQRDKRIQKQTEKLGGPKAKPKPRTLKQAAQRELKRAVLSTKGDGSLKADSLNKSLKLLSFGKYVLPISGQEL